LQPVAKRQPVICQGRINHCTGCTMGGPPPPVPPINCQILPRCLNVQKP